MLARFRAAGCIVCATLVSACASTQPPSTILPTSPDLPSSLSPAPAHEPIGRAGADGTTVLERTAFVRAVLDRNPNIESARQAWRSAMARVRQTGAFDDPMVDLSLAPLSIGSSSAPVGYNLGVTQRLPWFGKRGLDKSVAIAEGEAAKSDYETTRRDLALTASLLYDQYFVMVRSLEINEAHVLLVRELRAAAIAQFESGRGSAQDPLQAEAELTHMEHDGIRLRSQRDITVAQMNELLHRDPELPLPPPPRELPLSSSPDVHDSKRLQEEAIEHRPEIAAARERSTAERARTERAQREFYPDVSVSTSYSTMWAMPVHRWMVGIGLNIPIQTGRRAGAVDEADAARARFDSEAFRLLDKARTEVVVALKQLDESEHIVRLHEERLLPVARAQVDAARSGFIASRNSFLAVIDAEKNLRSVELSYQVARADSDRRHAELDRALGRVPGLDDRGVGR